MGLDDRSHMEPNAVLDRAARVRNEVRRQGRWHGWAWLAVGAVTPVFLIGTQTSARAVSFWIAIGFMVIGALLAVAEVRRGVVSQEAARVDRPMTGAYVVAMVAIAVLTIVVDTSGPPAWYAVLTVLPSVPCVLAAWKILR